MNNLKNCILFFLIGLISIWGQSTHSKNICFTETLSQSIISPNQAQLNVQTSGIQGITGEGLQINNKIKITSGQNKISAGQAAYDEQGGSITVSNGVMLENPNFIIKGEEAIINTDNETIILNDTNYFLFNIQARGSSKEFHIEENNQLRLIKPTYTTCNVSDQSWELVADEILLNEDEGKAKNVALRFKNIPLLYLPRLTFPTNDKRKSGFLTPSFGSSSKRGVGLEMPYYWNIAPNSDLKTTINWMEKRGTEIESELRFLSDTQNINLVLNHLPDDDIFQDDRTYSKLRYFLNPSQNLRIEMSGEYASDSNYFEDLSENTNQSSRTHLSRNLSLKTFGKNWFMNIGMTNYQMLNNDVQCLAIGICDDNQPYRLKPYVNFNGDWQNKNNGANLEINSEVVFFDHLQYESGQRLKNRVTLSRIFNMEGIRVKPSIGIDHAKFDSDLSNSENKRIVPIYSLDIDANFIKISNDGNIRHSIHPRLMVVHIPFRDQSNFPLIDTLQPDFNYFQLFEENRFVGNDRIGDTSKVSYGITSKRTELQTGRDLFEFTIGQTLHLKDEKIGLPGESKRNSGSITNLASMNWSISKKLKLKLDHYWDSDVSNMKRSQIGFEYMNGQTRRLNLSYRFRRQNIKQLHGTFSWPIKDRWSFISHYKYSIKDKKTIDQFFGINYETCCWSISAVSRKHLMYRNGETDSSFSIQFMFKGLGEFGTPINRVFEDGILAYDGS